MKGTAAMIKISPSVLACDFASFGNEINKVTSCGAEYVHIDVMDGHFVPNISFGIPVVEAARRITDAVLDVHLMISEPERYVEAFAKAGADIITFHYEATNRPGELASRIRSLGVKAGISVKPATPVSVLEPLLKSVDLILIMTVEPGFGGQKLNESCIEKVREIKKMCDMYSCSPEIEVDGGVTPDNAGVLISAGANVIVAGSAVFKSSDIPGTIKALKGDL